MSALIGQAAESVQEKVRSRVPRIAEAAVERARLTVVPRQATRAARVPFVVLVSLLLVGGVAGLLLFNTHMQQASFTATTLEEQADLLAAREQSLQMQLDTLREPQHLAVEARDAGMVPPGSPAFLRLSDGKVLGSMTPAVSGDGVRIRPLPTQKPENLRPDPVILKPPKPEKHEQQQKHQQGNESARGDRDGRSADAEQQDRQQDRQQRSER